MKKKLLIVGILVLMILLFVNHFKKTTSTPTPVPTPSPSVITIITNTTDNTDTTTDSTIPTDPTLDTTENYYINMNLLTTKSNLTADRLKNDILKISPDSPLAQYADQYILAEKNHGVNALFLVALSIREVGWDADTSYVKQYNNLFNYHLGRPDGTFTSWNDCIDKVSASLVTNYLTPGGKQYISPTIRGVSVNYCPSSQWAPVLVSVMERLEPSAPLKN